MTPAAHLTLALVHLGSVCLVCTLAFSVDIQYLTTPQFLFRSLETLHVVCCIRFMYFYLITGFGDYEKLVSVDWYVTLCLLMPPTSLTVLLGASG